jgi:hypothetical protein
MRALKAKVAKLLTEAREIPQLVLKSGVASMKCKGMTWDRCWEAVFEAIPEEDDDVLERVLAAIKATRAAPPRPVWDMAEGKEVMAKDEHYICYWILGLMEGSWSLPSRMPREALEAFTERYGCVLRRCERCMMGLANGRRFSVCPVCGNDKLSFKKLSGNEVDG